MTAGAATSELYAESNQETGSHDEFNRGVESGSRRTSYRVIQRRTQDQTQDKEYRPKVAGRCFDAGKQDAADTGDPADADHQHYGGEADHQAADKAVEVRFHGSTEKHFKILDKTNIWVFNQGIKAFRQFLGKKRAS